MGDTPQTVSKGRVGGQGSQVACRPQRGRLRSYRAPARALNVLQTPPSHPTLPYVSIAVGLPIRTTFQYRVPKRLQGEAAVGKRVSVPFGPRQLTGYIVGFADLPEVASVKPLTSVLDEKPVLQPDLIELTRWMSRVYQSGWGEAIQATLPGPLRRGKTTMKSREEEPHTAPIPTQPLTLTKQQQAAFQVIRQTAVQNHHQVFLLHGVTSSGKTEVYLQTIQDLLLRGKTSIVLVPEISLTPQTIERFQGRFGKTTVAVLHSRMLESRRLAEWRRIQSGAAKVVVGARSAVFAPVQDLGLIVVDEEHEPSYKQEDVPRYHAREVAIHRAFLSKALVILGSATPSIESYYLASQGRYHLLELTDRVEEIPLPKVEVVDMRQEIGRGRRGGRIFSRPLEEAIDKMLQEKQQGILFLNRRGFSTFVHCRKCGHVLRCKACQIALNYHISEKAMVCHYCRRSEPVPELCPNCKGDYVKFQGLGTQRVESELARNFPQAVLARMDTDATKVRGSHHEILERFKKGEIDLLVGTQMVAKGLDFPRVTLVGVVSADTALNLPDFRSAERTFNLLTQVAGRAGRSHLPGKVVVQTYTPHHYAIQAAKTHDYKTFYGQEIEIRRQLQLPPFTRLVQLMTRSQKEAKALEHAEKVAALCQKAFKEDPVEVIGPAPAPIPKLRRQYRWQVLLKSPTLDPIQKKLWDTLQQIHPPRGCYLAIDVDPL